MGGGIGEGSVDAKLTAEEVWEIRRIYDANTDNGKRRTGQTQRWLARHTGVPVGNIIKIVHWITWKKPSLGVSWAEWEREHGTHPRTNLFDGRKRT